MVRCGAVEGVAHDHGQRDRIVIMLDGHESHDGDCQILVFDYEAKRQERKRT